MYSSNNTQLGDLGEWYKDLLQTGTALYQKYTAIKDIKKQKKELEDYNRAMAEYRAEEERFRAQQIAVIAAQKAAKPVVQIPFIGAVDTTTMMILGGLVLGGVILLKRR